MSTVMDVEAWPVAEPVPLPALTDRDRPELVEADVTPSNQTKSDTPYLAASSLFAAALAFYVLYAAIRTLVGT